MASRIRILITTGDHDGIGWEVTGKALNAIGPKPGVQFVYFRYEPSTKKRANVLSRKFKTRAVNSLDEATALPFDPKTAIEIRSVRQPALWVEEAAAANMRGDYQALVTAPLSKTSIIRAGLGDIGHTEILGRVSGEQNLFMGFVGAKFSVLLASGHQPLGRALNEMTPQRMALAFKAAGEMRALLPPTFRKRPIALVGVNPHAGENGLIGKDEIWMRKLMDDFNPGLDIEGPLVPDAAFLPQNWERYALYICPYHDQGLIPFKMVHGFNGGVHLTLGLPFVRTSVDHGTAKELFGKNKAQFGSMRDALLMAIRLCKETGL
jgi:4-hydroxythreonine-4-phosphate dehydrogenase